jgi:cytochrome oxidase assembly protein ShyY1
VPSLLQPRAWGAHLLMLLAVAAATGLGLWQLQVWSAHRADAQRDLTNARPVALASVMGGDSPFPGGSLGRPVTFAGSWLPAGTVYVSDRRLDGRTGYWVVTPVAVDGTQSAMPVVRGWSARPEATAPTGDVRVSGWLQASEADAPDDRPTDDVIPSMRIASLTQHVDADLYSGYVVSRTADSGLRPVTPASVPPVSSTTSLRNFLYALQWWFFAGFAIYIWLRWCRDQLAAGREPGPGAQPDDVPDDVPDPADQPAATP